ncbi:MAG: cysteine desulfurase family protein [Patescibacteria group bacterium]
MKHIYLDHSATTPVDKKVLKEMTPYFTKKYGNASSLHNFGQIAMAAIDKARKQVADHLNCSSSEIVFTSGATESNNLAIRGVVKALQKKGVKNPHIITSLIEHPAVLEPCAELQKEGIEVTYVKVKSNGAIDIDDFRNAIKDNTVLVSIMHVNSEVGSIQPIKEIGKIIRKANEKRMKDWLQSGPKERGEKPQPVYFHTDATQAVNYLNCDVQENYADLLSLSGHKIYGPKGIGVLYVKAGTLLRGMQLGGHQENSLRSGTLNVPGIVGLGAAIGQIDEKTREKNNKKIAKLRDKLIAGIIKKVPDVVLNTDRSISTPSHAHFSFLGVEGESILISLDLEGVAVSTGSACASGSLKPSHVLLAMGIRQEVAHNSIRFTLGKDTTDEDIRHAIKVMPTIIKKLRKMVPEGVV